MVEGGKLLMKVLDLMAFIYMHYQYWLMIIPKSTRASNADDWN